MPNHSTITNQVPPKTHPDQNQEIPLLQTKPVPKPRKKASQHRTIPPVNHPGKCQKELPCVPQFPLSKGFSTKKKKGSQKAALNELGTR
jgi:hypothetical protein